MIYNRTGKFFHLTYKPTHFKSLAEWIPDKDVIYYFHPYDQSISGIPMLNAIDDIHWDHLRSEPTAKFLYENCNETFTFELALQIKELITTKEIPASKIFMIVMDEVHKSFLEDRFKELDISDVTIGIYNMSLEKTTCYPNRQAFPNERLVEKKFSALSRNYRAWRLHLYALLAKTQLLNNFVYSFYNIFPYGTVRHYDKATMLADLEATSFGIVDNSVSEWLDHVPYELPNNNVLNKWDDITYRTIFSADFHLLVETHYDFYYVPLDSDNIYHRKLAPSSVTEKGYKPIACGRPFIAFSTPYFLEQIRELGFETFSPHINEDYDLELDSKKRLEMIVAEVKRISNLYTNKYQHLLEQCNEIAKRNKELFITKQSNKQRNLNFAFMPEHFEVLHIIH